MSRAAWTSEEPLGGGKIRLLDETGALLGIGELRAGEASSVAGHGRATTSTPGRVTGHGLAG